jgi:DNA modification methylase
MTTTDGHLGALKHDPRNARAHTPRNEGMIAESIRRAGAGRSLLAARDGTILAGNATYDALASVGMEDIIIVDTDGTKAVVVRRTDLDPDSPEAVHLALADNRAAELADWDPAMLNQVLLEFPEAIDATFFPEEIDALLGSAHAAETLVENDQGGIEAPPDRVPVVKKGDLWRVGDVFVLCADSDTRYGLPPGMLWIDLLVTDPPWGVNVIGGTHNPTNRNYRKHGRESKTIAGDSRTPGSDNDAHEQLLSRICAEADVHLKPGGVVYVFAPSSTGTDHYRSVVADYWPIRQEIVCVKDTFVFGQQDYHWEHETVLYGWKPGAAHLAVEDRTQSTVWPFGRIPANHKFAHPAQKPVELIGRMVGNSSKPGEWVADVCCGSGATLVAAAKLGRRGFGIDNDPRYADLSVERLQEATGMVAQKVVSG